MQHPFIHGTIFISIVIRSMDLNIVQHWQFSLSPSHTPPPPSALQQTLGETPPQCNQPPSPGEESTQQNPSDTTTTTTTTTTITITTTNISEIISQNICYFTNNGFPYPVQCVHAIACSSFHNHILLPTIPRNRNEFFNFNSCPISNIFMKNNKCCASPENICLSPLSNHHPCVFLLLCDLK